MKRKVVAIYYEDEPKYPNVRTGLILELEDGEILHHAQDGAVVPIGLDMDDQKEESTDGGI